jgi:hypothetical protein
VTPVSEHGAPQAVHAFAGEGVSVDAATGTVLADSVTRLTHEADGAVVATGSHGGTYAAFVVARSGARGAILNDASVGREGAGIAGLAYLDRLGIPAVAVHHRSARIGSAAETFESGVASFVNRTAMRLGCRAGRRSRECAARMREAAPAPRARPDELREARRLVLEGPHRVWALDSVSLVRDADRGDVLVTGSHGALLGGRPATAMKKDALAVVFNDAGGGEDGRGRTRLAPLDERGIAAATVHAASARIGDGRSTFATGRISDVNGAARALGVREGLTVPVFVELVLRRP